MSFDAQRIFELLPTVYRVRDAEAGRSHGALRALLDVIAAEVGVLEEDLAQLYDDQFIETCAPWVAPYIGDLIGYRTLYGIGGSTGTPRAEVAHTIAFRRRKGTASMLEQLARDVTGWDARAVEFFERLATTQYMNHVRRHNVAWVDMRASAALAAITTPFDQAAHTADVRRIARGRGRHNIPNVGLYLWRVQAYRLGSVPATKLVPGDAADRRYLFNPLGANLALCNDAVAEDTITHIAERANVPMPITRRELRDAREAFYPGSLVISAGGRVLPADVVASSDLSDLAGGWAYAPDDAVLIDPVLGRLWLPDALEVSGRPVDMVDPVVSFHYGFTADIGGGTYPRLATFAEDLDPIVEVAAPASIGDALAGLSGSGVVEVRGSDRFTEPLAIDAPGGARIEVRGADGARPAVALGTGDIMEWPAFAPADLDINLADDSEITLNGLVLIGGAVRVLAGARRGRLRLRHCTVIPGGSLEVNGAPRDPARPSLVIESGSVAVEIDHCILGGIRADGNSTVTLTATIVDAIDPAGVAFAALDGSGPGGELVIRESTIIGKVHTRILRLVSNTILMARLAEADVWPFPVHAERRQDGCVRFSYVPPGSRTPRRHRCQPSNAEDSLRVQPQFTSERYGHPAYCQLSDRSAVEIRTGADDESEMGAFHDLFAPQRQTNLQVRLEEYLRFGLEAGIFRAS